MINSLQLVSPCIRSRISIPCNPTWRSMRFFATKPFRYPVPQHIPTLEETGQFPFMYPPASTFPARVDTPYFRFEVLYQSKKSKARVGRIHTPHGVIDTPGFVPVATNAALKYVDLSTTCKPPVSTQLIFSNTYHLIIHPGPDVIAKAGGIHKWCNYDGALITDSGGFQVFSMSNTEPQQELKGKLVRNRTSKSQKPPNLIKKITEESVQFKSYRDGTLIHLSPSSSVEAQKKIGADIIIPLDILLPNNVPYKKLLQAFHQTHRWEAESLQTHLKNLNNQAMYSVLHGGNDMKLRKLSMDYLTSLPFQGMAIGGSLGKDTTEMRSLLQQVVPMIPFHLPIHLLGIGDPPSIEFGVACGVDTFDSSFPTKSGRHGRLFSEKGNIDITKLSMLNESNSPPVPGCDCPVYVDFDNGKH